MGRKRLKGVKRHRHAGHRPKYNKKSVKERRRLRLLKEKNAISSIK